MAEVNCVSLKDIRTFCHATRLLEVSSVDSLLYGGSEVTCRKPDTFLLVATFAASFTAILIIYYCYQSENAFISYVIVF